MTKKYEIDIKYSYINIVNRYICCNWCGEKIFVGEKCFIIQQPDLTTEIRHEKCLEENLK